MTQNDYTKPTARDTVTYCDTATCQTFDNKNQAGGVMFEVVLMIGFLWAGLCRLGLDAEAEVNGEGGGGRTDPTEASP
jgi:hypothetical protein